MAEVTALRRPPVRQSVLVRSSRAHTLETFVGELGELAKAAEAAT